MYYQSRLRHIVRAETLERSAITEKRELHVYIPIGSVNIYP